MSNTPSTLIFRTTKRIRHAQAVLRPAVSRSVVANDDHFNFKFNQCLSWFLEHERIAERHDKTHHRGSQALQQPARRHDMLAMRTNEWVADLGLIDSADWNWQAVSDNLAEAF